MSAGNFCGIAFQREDDIQARGLNCRGESKDNAGCNRNDEGEREDAVIQTELERRERIPRRA